ncbi:hypothetical protein Dimus_026665 [Dionaea muscipula]
MPLLRGRRVQPRLKVPSQLPLRKMKATREGSEEKFLWAYDFNIIRPIDIVLDDTNYNIWAQRMSILWRYVSGDKLIPMKAEKATSAKFDERFVPTKEAPAIQLALPMKSAAQGSKLQAIFVAASFYVQPLIICIQSQLKKHEGAPGSVQREEYPVRSPLAQLSSSSIRPNTQQLHSMNSSTAAAQRPAKSNHRATSRSNIYRSHPIESSSAQQPTWPIIEDRRSLINQEPQLNQEDIMG